MVSALRHDVKMAIYCIRYCVALVEYICNINVVML